MRRSAVTRVRRPQHHATCRWSGRGSPAGSARPIAFGVVHNGEHAARSADWPAESQEEGRAIGFLDCSSLALFSVPSTLCPQPVRGHDFARKGSTPILVGPWSSRPRTWRRVATAPIGVSLHGVTVPAIAPQLDPSVRPAILRNLLVGGRALKNNRRPSRWRATHTAWRRWVAAVSCGLLLLVGLLEALPATDVSAARHSTANAVSVAAAVSVDAPEGAQVADEQCRGSAACSLFLPPSPPVFVPGPQTRGVRVEDTYRGLHPAPSLHPPRISLPA